MKEKKQTRKRKGVKPIARALLQMEQLQFNEAFYENLMDYMYIISELDYGKKLSVDKLGDSDYMELGKILRHMAKKYGVSKIEKWCNIKKTCDLYRIQEAGQIHFYEETRSFFMSLHRRDHGEARNAYARSLGIPTPSSQLNRKEIRMHEIYAYIKKELFQPELTKPKDKDAKATAFSKLEIVALSQRENELQQQLTQSDHDLKQSGQDAEAYTEAEWRQESILTELLDLYTELLCRPLPDDVLQRYQNKRCTCRNELEVLKAKKYHLYSNPEMLHIKLNLLEGIPEEQFVAMDPTQEKQNRIYSRCRKEFERKAAELLDHLIEEITQEVTKELEQEAEQQMLE